MRITNIKHTKFLVFLSVILAVLKPVHAQDDEDEEETEKPLSCQQYIFKFVNGILKSMLKCLAGKSTLKLKNVFELPTRAGCLFKCIFQEEGTINFDDGRLDDISAAFYFEETFAQEVREIAIPELQRCFAMSDAFDNSQYWCQSYVPFTECAFSAILKGLIPYAGQCVTRPALGILFSVIKYLAPAVPAIEKETEELERAFAKSSNNNIRCMDVNCTRIYEYKKVNNKTIVTLYDKDMNVLSVTTKNELKLKKATTNNGIK